MSADDTREVLAAMVREGEAVGLYADDHGAAGFCTDHGQAALDVDVIRESVETADGNGENCPLCVPGTDDLCAYHQGYDAGWAKCAERAHAARDAEVERLAAINGAITSELRSAMAEVERLRAILDAGGSSMLRKWWLAAESERDEARAALAALREAIDEARRDFQGTASRRKARGEEWEDVQDAADVIAALAAAPSETETGPGCPDPAHWGANHPLRPTPTDPDEGADCG